MTRQVLFCFSGDGIGPVRPSDAELIAQHLQPLLGEKQTGAGAMQFGNSGESSHQYLHYLEGQLQIPLNRITTNSEPLFPEAREMAREAWGINIHNSWGSVELGGHRRGEFWRM